MKKEFYKAGELANLAGVSYKTIRHYRETGLLRPEGYTESGYGLYGLKSVETLQRILMLRYLNFSLEEIKNMLFEEEVEDTFKRQEGLLQAQEEHISQLRKAVQEIQKVSGEERWEKMLAIIHATQQKEEIIKQYRDSSNLQKRIDIHVYSTSKKNWFQWIFEGLELKEGMKILELGCGNGMLWAAMKEQLPKGLQIYMTDNSEKMLEAARQKIEQDKTIYQEKNIQFVFLQMDAEDISVTEGGFDRIIANHMLYHVSNEKRPLLLKRCHDLLKEEGMFYASTVGKEHMRELPMLTQGFDKRIAPRGKMTDNFTLENGMAQLEQVFASVAMEEEENNLLVPDWRAIHNYVESWPGMAETKKILKEREKDWIQYLKENVSEENPYFIHKSTGAFKAKKHNR